MRNLHKSCTPLHTFHKFINDMLEFDPHIRSRTAEILITNFISNKTDIDLKGNKHHHFSVQKQLWQIGVVISQDSQVSLVVEIRHCLLIYFFKCKINALLTTISPDSEGQHWMRLNESLFEKYLFTLAFNSPNSIVLFNRL